MNPNRRQHDDHAPDLKSIATGRARKWDARLTPNDTAALWEREKAKANWLCHVAVLEDGTILSGTTPPAEAAQRFEESPCIGFVGGLWTNKEKRAIQFFTKQLRVSRDAQAKLDLVIQLLGQQVEGTMQERDLAKEIQKALQKMPR